MRTAGGKNFTIREWLILFGTAAAAVLATELIGLTKRSQSAVVYTVIVFTVVILALRPAWRRRAFWRSLVLAFIFHALAVVLVSKSLPGTSAFPGLVLVVAAMAESLLIAGVLWRKAVGHNRDNQFR